MLAKLNESFSLGGGVLRYQGRLCFPNIDGLRIEFLTKLILPVTPFIRVLQRIIMIVAKCFGGKT